MARVQAHRTRGVLREQKGNHNAHCRHRAIGRDDKGADVEKNGMHLDQHTAFAVRPRERGLKRKRIRPTGPWAMGW